MKTDVALVQAAKRKQSLRHSKSEQATPIPVITDELATLDLQVDQAAPPNTHWGMMTQNVKRAMSGGILQGQDGLVVQQKMTLGEVGDKYEQEADRLAPQVVRQINSSGFGKQFDKSESEVAGTAPKTQLKAIRPALQFKGDSTGSTVSPAIESAINSARAGGQPLEPGLQQQLGQAMGADFSGVRVHTDERADALNKSVGARAFTTGQELFFKRGEYQPGSRGGQELIAHELTHVVQQNGINITRRNDQKLENTINSKEQHLNLVSAANSVQRITKDEVITAPSKARKPVLEMGGANPEMAVRELQRKLSKQNMRC